LAASLGPRYHWATDTDGPCIYRTCISRVHRGDKDDERGNGRSACMYACVCVRTCVCMSAYASMTPTHTDTHTNTRTHTQRRTHTHTHTHTPAYANTHTRTHIHQHLCTHIHKYFSIHTHMHQHICTHTHSLSLSLCAWVGVGGCRRTRESGRCWPVPPAAHKQAWADPSSQM
jgi:hypothetical protein